MGLFVESQQSINRVTFPLKHWSILKSLTSIIAPRFFNLITMFRQKVPKQLSLILNLQTSKFLYFNSTNIFVFFLSWLQGTFQLRRSAGPHAGSDDGCTHVFPYICLQLRLHDLHHGHLDTSQEEGLWKENTARGWDRAAYRRTRICTSVGSHQCHMDTYHPVSEDTHHPVSE